MRSPRWFTACVLAATAVGAAAAPIFDDAGPRERAPATADLVAASAALADQPLSRTARRVAAWAVDSGNADGDAFVMIDKARARVYVFEDDGRLRAASPVLLGLARGDDSVPGIGERPIKLIRPHERTTPAGRFLGEEGRNAGGEDIVWVDYDAAVSMHRVRPTNPKERRLERLASSTSADNRISYGCINVPADFFDEHIKPLFAGGHKAPIYVLPETRSALRQFRIDEPPRAGTRTARLMPKPRQGELARSPR